jgi:hypothetical protein
MYCPSCGTEFTKGQKYCRSCGTNLMLVSKAVTLGEAIGRSDRGAVPKMKAVIENLGLDKMTADISKGLEEMTREIEQGIKTSRSPRRRKSPEEQRQERREKLITGGFVSFFTGIGLAIFLYYLGGALVLRIPPEKLARVPFELEPVVRIAWLLGLIPALSGFGQIIAGLLTRPAPVERVEAFQPLPTTVVTEPSRPDLVSSVTEHTTELLEGSNPARGAARQRE